MKHAVEMKNISMIYQSINGEIKALENINLDIGHKEFVSIIGPSGCGKSTLLSIIAGLIIPTSGQLYIYGRPVLNVSTEVGYMLQKDHLFDWRTIYENVLLGLEIRKQVTQDSKEYVNILLNKYGLYEFKDKYPSQLSGGMRQRAALIRTLAVNPQILLLDEAFSALDYQTRLAVSEDIYSIIKNEGKTAILVTHDISEGISMADRLVVLTKRPGRIKSIYELEFECENKTPLTTRNCKEFRNYFNQVWNDLDVHIETN